MMSLLAFHSLEEPVGEPAAHVPFQRQGKQGESPYHDDHQGRHATQAVKYLVVGLGSEIDRLCIHVEIGVLSVLSVAKISIPREKKEKYWKNRPQSIPVSVQIV